MFQDYPDTERVCKDCLQDRYFSYPDGKNRCKYCGHVEGTPQERSTAPAEPVDTTVTGKTVRRRNA